MKKPILLAVLSVFMLSVNSQEKKETKKAEKQVVVPVAVKKAFALKFPAAAKVEWGIEKPGRMKLNLTKMKQTCLHYLTQKELCWRQNPRLQKPVYLKPSNQSLQKIIQLIK